MRDLSASWYWMPRVVDSEGKVLLQTDYGKHLKVNVKAIFANK